MSTFSRMRATLWPATILLLGVCVAWGDDGKGRDQKEENDSQPVTVETRQQIAEMLLSIAQNPKETAETRIAAIQSLKAYSKNAPPQLRNGVLHVALEKMAKPKLRIMAATMLLNNDFELSKKERTAIAAQLWSDFVAIDDDALVGTQGGGNRQIRAWALLDLARLETSPPNTSAVLTLIEIANTRLSPAVYPGFQQLNSATVAKTLLDSLQESPGGVQLMIETVAGTKSPDALPRIRLLKRLRETIPKTEGIAQVLLEAASHGDPGIRAAAIEALGNEVSEGEERSRPADSTAPPSAAAAPIRQIPFTR